MDPHPAAPSIKAERIAAQAAHRAAKEVAAVAAVDAHMSTPTPTPTPIGRRLQFDDFAMQQQG
jgi:hypothetical protein